MILVLNILLASTVFAQDPFAVWNPLLANNLQSMQYADRYWIPQMMFHHYVAVNSSLPAVVQPAFIREEDVGRVVSSASKMQTLCETPLVTITRYERTPTEGLAPVSLFSKTSPTGGWTAKASFFCSPTIGNCGANWQLTMFPMNNQKTTGDIFYPSNPSQLSIMNLGIPPWTREGTVVCYIWK